MAHAIVFDTLAYANKLKAAGVPEKQAEIQAETFAEIIEEKIATKHDLKEMEHQINLKLFELKNDIIKWTIGIVLAATSAQTAITLTFFKLLH